MRKVLNTFIVLTLLVTLSLFSIGCDDDDDDEGRPVVTPSPSPVVTPSPSPVVTPSPSPVVTPSPSPVVTPSPSPPIGANLEAAPVATAPTSCDDPIWEAEAEEIDVPTSNADTNMLYGDGELNMSGTFEGITDFNGGQPANLRLTALYTADEIFIRARWDDMVRNIDRRRALFNGPADPLKPDEDPAGFTSQLNDDKIGLAFEIESASSEFGTFNEVGCAAACHNVAGEGLDMRPAEGVVDIWHWKTSRSEPLGFVNDQFTDPDGRRNDAGTALEVRNLPEGGNARSGPGFIWDGTPQTIPAGSPREGETLDPAFTLLTGHLLDVSGRDANNGEAIYQTSCAGCHGANGEGGVGPPLNDIEEGRKSDTDLDAQIAAPSHPGSFAYNPLTIEQKEDLRLRIFSFWGVPGYYLTIPTESNADIPTITDLDYSQAGIDSLTNTVDPQGPEELNKYKFEQDGYCVVITRGLETGFPDDDVQFTDLNQTYVFGVALMDNDGKNHIGNTKMTLSFRPSTTASKTTLPSPFGWLKSAVSSLRGQ